MDVGVRRPRVAEVAADIERKCPNTRSTICRAMSSVMIWKFGVFVSPLWRFTSDAMVGQTWGLR